MMPAIIFTYTVTASLAVPVSDFGYAVRIPADTSCQRLLRQHVAVERGVVRGEKQDPLGNRILTGACRGTSARFACTVRGKALIDPSRPETDGDGQYTEATGRTHVGGLLRVFYLHNSAVGDALDRARHFCRMLRGEIALRTSFPGTRTAEEAMECGAGTSEDLAHIIAALCRLDNISVRYVMGLGPLGPAAWVEVWNGWNWTAIDPLTGNLCGASYLKIAHGRDADDIALAAFSQGCELEHTEISSSLSTRP
ncbi:transglutaminase domain-containing protein [Clostridiaceae bacterium]|nr:transglutaminase domain-containing protein [Clostridiaceae bacterium]MDE7035621.1 transglutaminase-like domain-containing protein [Eubacteriales bacterium]NBH80133.1 transglutaminase domain-containing protein [Clostridiaceae bacterium]NBI82867.1 transglutaminase domain-containing protein [Clostridiaceae bacterium]RKJ75454.1 transglutaminase domain-containing protein [Butyricicoccus sp. 1XD8-22]